MRLITKIGLLLMIPPVSVAIITIVIDFFNAVYELLLDARSLAISGQYEKPIMVILLLMFGVGFFILFLDHVLSWQILSD